MTTVNLALTSADSLRDASDNVSSMNNAATALVMGYVDSLQNTGGICFPNATIPKGATITTATLTLYATGKVGTPQLVVYAEAADNAADYTTVYPSARSLTTAHVHWSEMAASGDVSPADLAAVIQEITDRAGWSSGNNLNIVIWDESFAGTNYLATESVDAGIGHYATLSVTYTPPATGGWLRYRHI